MTCRHLVGYLGLALCAVLLSGCGQKGPLILPQQQDAPQQSAAPATSGTKAQP
ncbi:LPS translocon maturation chaperone LptM [Halothiobacillus diazotrophicus]|uniref:LPS translocon maturation chaperone LptM n=1 Tax=Halothiobacillus diazotrophicus TaxID=1860122 RepID=UPI000B10B979|nr:lipoprotein [Halothiobacillus diazotrophicus]